jgi:hypothetical protein
MGSALRDKTVLIIGRGSGIARAVTLLARSEGARVVVAGRDRTKLADAYADLGDPGISAEVVDITDDASIAALADRVGRVDHVVSTASARARGNLADLQRENLRMSFDTKVIGPAMLAKYFAGQINPGGSFVLFSGVHAFKSTSAISASASPMAPSISSPDGSRSSLPRSGSMPSRRVSSTPVPGIRLAQKASGTTSNTSPPEFPRDGSGTPRTSPAPCCSR